MISGLFILSHKGEPIIKRVYRDDITESITDVFKVHVVHSRTGVRSPIVSIAKKSFFHIYRNNIYVVAVTCQNANACMVVEFLQKFVDLCTAYFGKFDYEAVRQNFCLIYELLDEVADNGYPQSTDPDTLKILTQDAKELMAGVNAAEDMKEIASQVTGQIGWRREGITYKKREWAVFLDVTESVHCLVSPSGATLSAHVAGVIKMRCALSGMPECKFGINDLMLGGDKKPSAPAAKAKSKKDKKKKADPVAIDDLTFHQCVKLGKFDQNRSISFVPPDGDFDLFKYRVTSDVKLPFKVNAALQEFEKDGTKHMEMTVTVKGDFDKMYLATHVLITIPIPTTASRVQVNPKKGKAKYKAGANNVVWKLKTFAGQKTAQCDVKIELLKSTKKWQRPPIGLQFEAPFACSGLIVKYLIVQERKLGYDDEQVKKWVRYLSSAGSYEARY